MASSSSSLLVKLLFLLFITYIVFSSSKVEAQVEETSLKLMSDALEWPLSMSFYSDLNDNEEGDEEKDDERESGCSRRSLFWKRMRYYISYGALSANRIPCPPRSGRLMALSILTLGDVPGSLGAGDELRDFNWAEIVLEDFDGAITYQYLSFWL
ncbi:hypothetical protein CRYUN_Cryun17cG0122100 [Craigia yunnanensis]